jgi:hypothetical protein
MLKLINEAKIEGLELGQRQSSTVGECDTYAEIEWLVMIERGNLAESCAPVSDSSRLLDSSSVIQRNNVGREYRVSEISESRTTLITKAVISKRILQFILNCTPYLNIYLRLLFIHSYLKIQQMRICYFSLAQNHEDVRGYTLKECLNQSSGCILTCASRI